MKVLVGIKRVIDYNVRVRVKSDHSGVDLDNVKMSMNPFDENALEEAVKLKEAGLASEVIAVSVGDQQSQDILRTAFAIGADRGILIKTDTPPEPLGVAKLLAHIAAQEQPGLIILGKQAIDDDSNQTGQMLAGLLNWPQGTFAFSAEFNDEQVALTRETDTGLETLQLTLPAVITTDLRLNTPRLPKLPAIMKAKKKPIDILDAADTGIDLTLRLAVLSVTPPPARQAGIKVATVDELLDKLKNEAGII